MPFIKTFSELNAKSVAEAGGKGASLGEMTRTGINVPPGFVILAQAFDRFCEKTDLNVEIEAILKTVDTDAMHTVDDASEKIHAIILGAEMPEDIADEIKKAHESLGAKHVAVRSSATAEDSAIAAWAGQLDTFLNVEKNQVLEKVKRCWASLFTPRAIFYRFEKKLTNQKISVAVVVQKMVESEVAGVAFSVHPVTQDRNQMIIEAGFGLGEALVSGQMTPDSYVVVKGPLKILDINIAEQKRMLVQSRKGNEWQEIPTKKGSSQKLSEEEILRLVKEIIRIEKHYGFPVDVEWALESGKFYILQSRPITTLGA